MSIRNGVIKNNSASDLETFASPGFGLCEDTPIEGFRGFKQPTVVLEKLDLTPHLKTATSPTPPKALIIRETVPPVPKTKQPKSILKNGQSQASTDKFYQKCSVNIFRDDLEKLKELLSENPKRFKVQSFASLNIMLKCKICDKVYPTEKKLHNHQKKKHMIIYQAEKPKSQKRVSFSEKVIVHDVKEYHKCRKCYRIFENYRALKSHMKEQHKKRKCYVCDYCMKNFVDRMFFKVHIKLHCESCGVLFPSKSKCWDHKRTVCKILKLYKCKTCDDSFFKFMDLKDHSYDHVDPCYVCDICKDQCPTKCAVAHHFYFLHSKRRKRRSPSLYITKKLVRENLFLCKFCEESSVDKDLIEQHVQLLPDLSNRAMTGYKDYYFCDQCLKKFDTETDMLQHKWTHFLKTSDNSQLRPKSILEDLLTNKKDIQTPKEKKTTFNVNEKIPEFLQPKLVLEKIKLDGKELTETVEFIDVSSFDITSGNIKKPIVDPKSKKTIISKHQCPTAPVERKQQQKAGLQGRRMSNETRTDANCNKYYSSNYCLTRHIETQHCDFENLQCKVCEEVFVWPSLLQSHKCIRLQLPEMPFEDARPEIHFDNFQALALANNSVTVEPETIIGFDDYLVDNDDYMNSVDFEIPAPIVELTELENNYIPGILNAQNGIPNVQNGIQNVQNGIQNVQNGIQNVQNGIPNVQTGIQNVQNCIQQMQNGQLDQNVNKLSTTIPSGGYKIVMQEVPIEF